MHERNVFLFRPGKNGRMAVLAKSCCRAAATRGIAPMLVVVATARMQHEHLALPSLLGVGGLVSELPHRAAQFGEALAQYGIDPGF